ncbi:DUF4214 domain-containing protein, partial [Methylobacterium sp. WL6]|uniref:DUF4214 domain-containing protein n=1 Tax=Methylobacterium sp. WL6 TaxID=2603901 RepID=UPI0011C7BFE3
AVTGVTADDFTVNTSGTATAQIASVSGSGTTYTVTLNQAAGDGTLHLDLKAAGTGITDAAGNGITGGSTGTTTTLDHTAPSLTLALSAGTGLDATHGNRPLITDAGANAQVLNAAEFADAFRLGGMASDANFNGQSGAVVTFTAADGHTVPAHSVPLVSDGTGGYRYAFRVDGPGTANGVNADLAAALTDGTYTVQAVTQDVAGNPGVTAAQTLIVDTSADVGHDAALTVSGTADGVVNAAEAAALAFTVAGLDSDATAVATFTDGTHTQMVQVAANGTGSVNLTGFDGAISSSLAITDIHQNVASAVGNTVQADTAAPTLAVSGVSGATNLVDGHVVSGTIDTADAALAVTISDGTTVLGTAAVDAQGDFTFALPTDMAGGTSHAYALTANATDAAGNLGASDSFAFALDYTPNQSLFGAVTHDVSSPAGEAYALYDGLLGRTPDAPGLEGWANALTHGASLHDVSLSFLASEEFTAKYGGAYTTGSDDAFVQYLYHEALGRDPDAQGEASWVSFLASGESRADVAFEFALSPENQGQIAPALQAGVFVADPAASAVAHLYYGLLDRAPDAGGLQSFTDLVHNGGSLTSVAQTFLSSAEYANLHPTAQTDQQYVDSLYTHALGRSADAGGEQSWVDALSHGASRADVAVGLAESLEASLHLAGHVEAGWHLA